MNIICTGISCSGRKELMEDFESLCREKGVRIGFFNVGDFMKRAAAASGVQFTEKVLDSDHAVLSLSRRSAFYEIANLAHDYDHAFIGLHASFSRLHSRAQGTPSYTQLRKRAPGIPAACHR